MPRKITRKPFSRFVPISATLLARICRDYAAVTLLAIGLAISWHWLWFTFLPRFNMKYQLTMFRRVAPAFKAIMGGDLEALLGKLSQTSIGAVAYLHPVTLIILLAYAVMLPSGLLVGQIDRGTIEFTLSTPLSRRKLIFTTILAGCMGGALLILAMLAGTAIGRHFTTLTDPYHFHRIVICAVNLYAVYLVAFAISTVFSSFTRVRSYAVGWPLGLGLIVYLLHFLAEWWQWVKKISFLGPIHYYHPIRIATEGYNPITHTFDPAHTFDPTNNIIALIAAAAVLFAIAAYGFSRRDIAVV